MAALRTCCRDVAHGPNRTLVAFATNGGFEPKAAPEPITLTTPKQTFVLGSKHPCGDARLLEAHSGHFSNGICCRPFGNKP